VPPSARQSYAPVYVLDVRQLYIKLMQATNVDGVPDIARFFKLTDDEGWCAGNESASVGFLKKCLLPVLTWLIFKRTIIEIWKEMISSLPIDEQRDFRRSTLDPPSSASNPTPTPAPEPKPYVYDSDDDQDPNDIVVQPLQNAGKTDDPYAFDESDDSESD